MMEKIDTCYGPIDTAIFEKLKNIELIIFDVDGTLTDAGLYLDAKDGEYKKFNTKDGLGIMNLLKSGLKAAVITGRTSPLTVRRMKEVHIDYILQGQLDKGPALDKLCNDFNLTPDKIAVIGDDLNDLPLFQRVGFSACPKDAHSYIQKIASIVLHRDGGHGAGRELCDLLMMAHGLLNTDGGPK